MDARHELPLGWTEARVGAAAGASCVDAGAAAGNQPECGANIASGHSVLVVPNFACAAERDVLLDSASSVAARQAAAQRDGETFEAGPQSAAGRLRLHVPQRLDRPAQELTDRLVHRALAFVQTRLPAMGEAMLGREVFQLCELLPCELPSRFEFSPGEPAVNLYTAGGLFKPHEDQMGLTVLVTLSTPGEFTGGGTAFWAPGCRPSRTYGRKDVPSLVLAPPAGTALIFAGHLTHAAVEVKTGHRAMWVASFSINKAEVDRQAAQRKASDAVSPPPAPPFGVRVAPGGVDAPSYQNQPSRFMLTPKGGKKTKGAGGEEEKRGQSRRGCTGRDRSCGSRREATDKGRGALRTGALCGSLQRSAVT